MNISQNVQDVLAQVRDLSVNHSELAKQTYDIYKPVAPQLHAIHYQLNEHIKSKLDEMHPEVKALVESALLVAGTSTLVQGAKNVKINNKNKRMLNSMIDDHEKYINSLTKIMTENVLDDLEKQLYLQMLTAGIENADADAMYQQYIQEITGKKPKVEPVISVSKVNHGVRELTGVAKEQATEALGKIFDKVGDALEVNLSVEDEAKKLLKENPEKIFENVVNKDSKKLLRKAKKEFLKKLEKSALKSKKKKSVKDQLSLVKTVSELHDDPAYQHAYAQTSKIIGNFLEIAA